MGSCFSGLIGFWTLNAKFLNDSNFISTTLLARKAGHISMKFFAIFSTSPTSLGIRQTNFLRIPFESLKRNKNGTKLSFLESTPYHKVCARLHHLGSYLVVPSTYNTSYAHIYNFSQIQNLSHMKKLKSHFLLPPPPKAKKLGKMPKITWLKNCLNFFYVSYNRNTNLFRSVESIECVYILKIFLWETEKLTAISARGTYKNNVKNDQKLPKMIKIWPFTKRALMIILAGTWDQNMILNHICVFTINISPYELPYS